MTREDKLRILADSKYDASCASSGARRSAMPGGLGSTDGSTGICHSYTPDGRCVSPLELLLTNFCVCDFVFCVNRVGNDLPRARFTPAPRPDHHIVELTAGFFVDRFRAMRWSILTPDRSAHWDGTTLTFGDGLPREAAPADDGLEALWRTYYGAVFNPARLNLRAMRAEMPAPLGRRAIRRSAPAGPGSRPRSRPSRRGSSSASGQRPDALMGPQFRISTQRGMLLESPWATGLIATWHPSAVLRADDPAHADELYAQLVADLQLAARSPLTQAGGS